jgi:hypothetical protein
LCNLHPRPEGRGFTSQEDKDTLKKFQLDSVYLEDTDNRHNSFTWIFHAQSKQDIQINYYGLLTELIKYGSSELNTSNLNWNNFFNIISNQYLLSNDLGKKEQSAHLISRKKV